VPSYNVQLLTDVRHGLVVNVEATTDAIDYRQLQPALERCEERWDRSRSRSWPMATTPITRRCKRRPLAGWTSMDRGKIAGSRSNTMRKAAAPSSWPARSLRCKTGLLYLSCRKDPYSSRSAESRPRRTYPRVPRAKDGMSQLPPAPPVRSTGRAARVDAVHHAHQEPATTTAFKAKMATEAARQI